MNEFELDNSELIPNQEIINIGSWANTETEKMLSNFSDTHFWLNGKYYASVEGF